MSRKAKDKKIGIFDSGVGGLSVVAQILKKLPEEEIVYFGDTARYPYGPRSKEIIQKFSFQNLRFLQTHEVKLIVVACNTASAFALDKLKENFDMPMVGVIEPGAKAAVASTKTGRIGVIGTEGTINSQAYVKAINLINQDIRVFSSPCPLFVALAEEGYIHHKATFQIAEDYLKPFKNQKIDTLILGCTHYPLLKTVIDEVLEHKVTLIDSGEQTALEVKRILADKNLFREESQDRVHEYYVSDFPEKFIRVGEKFMGERIHNVQRINIEEY